jgi:hypothetical protein
VFAYVIAERDVVAASKVRLVSAISCKAAEVYRKR